MIITPTFNFAPISTWKSIINDGDWQIEAHEHYQKRSIRNKYDLLHHQGSLTMTIPLQKGKNAQMPIQDVLISYQEDWQSLHIKTIKSAYGKSPFYLDYIDGLEAVFTAPYESLWQFNEAAIKWTLKCLKLSIFPAYTTAYLVKYPEEVTDQRTNKQQPDTNLPFYNQVFEDRFGFITDLSVIDLIFCLGPGAGRYLVR